MAIIVLKRKEPPPATKEIDCSHCGSTLQYLPEDRVESTTYDYRGDPDFYYTILCPVCGTSNVESYK